MRTVLHRRRQKTPHKQAGFTLVELIAVIVILGILAAVIVPKYIDITDEARDSAARAALSEGISRITQAYSLYIITIQDSPESGDFATLLGADYLDAPGGITDIGGYKLQFTDAGTGITVTVLDDGTSNPITWQTDQYGTQGDNVAETVSYPQ